MGPFCDLSRLAVPSPLTLFHNPCLVPSLEGIRWSTGWWSTLPAPWLPQLQNLPANFCPLYGVQTPPLACHAPSQTTQYVQRVIFVHHHAPKGNSIPPYYGGGDRGSGKQQDFPAIKRRKPQSEHSSVQLPNQTVRDAKQPGSSDLAPHPRFLEGGQMFMQRREIISGYKTHSIPSLIALKEKTLPQSLGPFPSFPDLRLSMFPDSHHSLIHSFIYPFIHSPVHLSTH